MEVAFAIGVPIQKGKPVLSKYVSKIHYSLKKEF